MRVDGPARRSALRRRSATSSSTSWSSAGDEVAIEPGSELFREGEPADFWWVLVDGAIDLVRRVGREDTVVGRMDVPGRWAGGFRAWDEHGVYLATGRGASAGRVLRVPADGAARAVDDWFPFGVHLIEGVYRTARTIESTARQREALVTLGTLAAGLAHEINNPAAAATRAVDALEEACDALLSSLGRLARGRDHGRAVRRAGRPAPRDRAAGRRRWTRSTSPTARTSCRLARAPRRRAGLDDRPDRSPPPASTSPGATGPRTVLGGDGAASPGWSGWPSTLSAATLLARGARSRPGGSPSWSAAVRSYSQMDRASLQHDRRQRRAREHPGDARPQAPRRGHGRARLRRRRAADRGVRRRAQPGVDEPHRQRRRRDGRRRDAAGDRPGPTATASSSRSATPVPACRRRSRRARSRRSSRPRTSARAPASASTSPAASSSSGTAATIDIDPRGGRDRAPVRLPR